MTRIVCGVGLNRVWRIDQWVIMGHHRLSTWGDSHWGMSDGWCMGPFMSPGLPSLQTDEGQCPQLAKGQEHALLR